MRPIHLTEFQLEEIKGLLAICDDEPDRTPWGTVEGNLLTVTDLEDAVDDLEYRADFFIEEGPRHTGNSLTGQSASRSLYSLTRKIQDNA
jgi:hypothetical protein